METKDKKQRIAKALKIKDNFLCATIGEIKGEPVWINIAAKSGGKIRWFVASKIILIPEDLNADLAILLDRLENKRLSR